MSDEFTRFREPLPREFALLALVAQKAHGLGNDWLSGIAVSELSDGGMGSLELLVRGAAPSGRRFGQRVAELAFKDADGVDVLVSLNLDQSGHPFELDVWKTDLSPVVRFPST